MSIHNKFLTATSLLVLSTTAVLAENNNQLENNFDLSIMAGFTSLDQDGNYNYSSAQTDSLIQDGNDWGSWTIAIGVGYDYPLQEPNPENEVDWFPTVTPQLNLYYLHGGDIDGDVYLYQQPSLNLASYTSEFHSTRLMLDIDLTVFEIEEFSVFALGGLGVAFNSTGLNVMYDNPAFTDFSLESTSTTSFAYEFGAGMAYDITDDWGVYLEYLYANLGDANVNGTSNAGDVFISDSDIEMTSQSIILGMTFAI